MKIYVLPYTFKTYLSENQIHSGIDISMFNTIKVLLQLGHEVRLFCVGGDFESSDYSVKILNPQIERSELKEYCRKNRVKIQKHLLQDIMQFNPDLIFSSHDIKPLYKEIYSIRKYPTIYQSHAIPGFFSDLNNANLLHSLSQDNVYILNVSDYQRRKYEDYYSKDRSEWHFDHIKVDNILPSLFSEQEQTVVDHDSTVRHVSAMNPEKKTFAIHDYLSDTEIPTEVFTTDNYLTSNDKIKNYGKRNLKRFESDSLRTTKFNLPHDEIMEAISRSVCTFVGLASYDTYTITSLESLLRGVPVIAYGTKDRNHPILEMCDDKMKSDYIRIVRNADEFRSSVNHFSSFDINDRMDLARRSHEFNSIDKYKKKLEYILSDSLKKIDINRPQTSILEQFM